MNRLTAFLSARRKKPRFYYGYTILLAGFLVMIILAGTIYSFGVFLKPVAADFGWTRAATSGAYSLFLLLQGFLSIFAGRMNDRFGPRIVMTACGLFFGLSFILTSRIDAIWQLYLSYGLFLGIGVSGSYIPIMSTVARWFASRKGLVTGIVISGMGTGTVVIPPMVSRLISSHGWRDSSFALGIAILVLLVLLAQFFRRNPVKAGSGDRVEVMFENDTGQASSSSEMGGFSPGEAVRTRQFWLFALSFAFFGFGMQSVFVHMVPHATDLGIPAIAAANILAVIGGSSIAGRIVMGSASDRVGSKRASIISFVFPTIALVILLEAKELWAFYLFAALFGFGYGGLMALMSVGVVELFGLRAHGAILGAVICVAAIGEAPGVPLSGYIFDVTKSYYSAFMLSAALAFSGLVLTSLLKPVVKNKASNLT